MARSYQGTAAPKLSAARTVQKDGCHPRPPPRKRLFSANYAECGHLGLATICSYKERFKVVTSFTFISRFAYECQGMPSIWIKLIISKPRKMNPVIIFSL
jgi:hypothetical protein